jgi:hypothetical protein
LTLAAPNGAKARSIALGLHREFEKRPEHQKDTDENFIERVRIAIQQKLTGQRPNRVKGHRGCSACMPEKGHCRRVTCQIMQRKFLLQTFLLQTMEASRFAQACRFTRGR